MNNNNKHNNDYGFDNDSAGELFSWIIVLICMFAFFPLGLFMLLRKIKPSAKNSGNYMPQTGSASTPGQTAKPVRKTPRKKDAYSPFGRKNGKFVSFMLLLISIVLLIVGANTVFEAIGGISAGRDMWPDLGMGIFYIIGGFVSFFSRNVGVRRISRYKKYHALVGDRVVMPIRDIAGAAGTSIKSARRDLQAMIDVGYFGAGAYIDSGLDSLVLSAGAADEIRRAAKSAHTRQNSQEAKPENQYVSIINELRSLNDTIADIPISDKIDRIEGLTAKIFRTVEDNPAKLPQIRRFMNYYLPTTLKLLHSYATLEKQGIKGENITAAKENIDRILETLATGFEQQLDLLFKSDVIDISSDINVLENMMRQDGLTGERHDFKTMEGGGV